MSSQHSGNQSGASSIDHQRVKSSNSASSLPPPSRPLPRPQSKSKLDGEYNSNSLESPSSIHTPKFQSSWASHVFEEENKKYIYIPGNDEEEEIPPIQPNPIHIAHPELLSIADPGDDDAIPNPPKYSSSPSHPSSLAASVRTDSLPLLPPTALIEFTAANSAATAALKSVNSNYNAAAGAIGRSETQLCFMGECGKTTRASHTLFKGYCKLHFAYLFVPHSSSEFENNQRAKLVEDSPFTINLIATGVPQTECDIQTMEGLISYIGPLLLHKNKLQQWWKTFKDLQDFTKENNSDMGPLLSFFCITLHHRNTALLHCSCPTAPCPLFALRTLWGTNLLYNILRPSISNSENIFLRALCLRIVWRLFQLFHNLPACQLYQTLQGRENGSVFASNAAKSTPTVNSAINASAAPDSKESSDSLSNGGGVAISSSSSKSVMILQADNAALSELQSRHDNERLYEYIYLAATSNHKSREISELILDTLFQLLTDKIPPQQFNPDSSLNFPIFPIANMSIDLFSSPIRNPILLPAVYTILRGTQFALRSSTLKNLYSGLVGKSYSAELLLHQQNWQQHCFGLLVDLPRPAVLCKPTDRINSELIAQLQNITYNSNEISAALSLSQPAVTITRSSLSKAEDSLAGPEEVYEIEDSAGRAGEKAVSNSNSSGSASNSKDTSDRAAAAPQKAHHSRQFTRERNRLHNEEDIHKYVLGLLRQLHMHAFTHWKGQRFGQLLRQTVRTLFSYCGSWNSQNLPFLGQFLQSILLRLREKELATVIRNANGDFLWINLLQFFSILLHYCFFTNETAALQAATSVPSHSSNRSGSFLPNLDSAELEEDTNPASFDAPETNMLALPRSILHRRRPSHSSDNSRESSKRRGESSDQNPLDLPEKPQEQRAEKFPASFAEKKNKLKNFKTMKANIFAKVASLTNQNQPPGSTATSTAGGAAWWKGPTGVNVNNQFEEPLFCLTPAAETGVNQNNSSELWSDTLQGLIHIHLDQTNNKAESLQLILDSLQLLQAIGMDRFDPKQYPSLEKEELEVIQNMARMHELFIELRDSLQGHITVQEQQQANEREGKVSSIVSPPQQAENSSILSQSLSSHNSLLSPTPASVNSPPESTNPMSPTDFKPESVSKSSILGSLFGRNKTLRPTTSLNNSSGPSELYSASSGNFSSFGEVENSQADNNLTITIDRNRPKAGLIGTVLSAAALPASTVAQIYSIRIAEVMKSKIGKKAAQILREASNINREGKSLEYAEMESVLQTLTLKPYYFRLTMSHLVYNKGSKFKSQHQRVLLDNLAVVDYVNGNNSSSTVMSTYPHIQCNTPPPTLQQFVKSHPFSFQVSTVTESHVLATVEERQKDDWLQALSHILSILRRVDGRIGSGLFGMSPAVISTPLHSMKFPEELFNPLKSPIASTRVSPMMSIDMSDYKTRQTAGLSIDVAPVMVVKKTVTNCQNSGCKVMFTLFKKKHHCYNCGLVFCDTCSKGRFALKTVQSSQQGTTAGQIEDKRVCDTCFTELGRKKNWKKVQLTTLIRSRFARPSVMGEGSAEDKNNTNEANVQASQDELL
jgi:hypothetical protein